MPCNCIKTFDFFDPIYYYSTFKTQRALNYLCFGKKGGKRRHKSLVQGRDKPYFVVIHCGSNKMYSEDGNIIIMFC